MAKLKRSSGLLLHPTSLPGGFGIGEINENAFRWVDFLAKAGQTMWQILPLGPTGYGNSPYQTTSVFAGNPLLIDMARLAAEGYIPPQYLTNTPDFPSDRVDFEKVINWKLPILLQAYGHFVEKAGDNDQEEFRAFSKKHAEKWLDEFALYMALKNHYHLQPWNEWPNELKLRDPAALEEMSHQLQGEILSHKFLQFQFFKQWNELRSYANKNGIQILGDIPIYATYDSAEVWANKEGFCLDKEGNPTVVAGVPPDYFSETGQLWGNPLYKWETMVQNGFSWWKDRIRITLESVDIVRIDHFRGFESYWAVPFGEETAVKGQWLKGPDRALFDSLIKELEDVPIIVEDLGFITPEVEALRDRYKFPGMKILQFSFGEGPQAPYLPHNYNPNCVVYTGSHDNDTTKGWFAKAPKHEQEYCLEYIGKANGDIVWELMRLASSSTAIISIFPVQDVLSLDSDARMNIPGQPAGNWGWRLQQGRLTDEHADKLAHLAKTYGRLNAKNKS